MTVLLVKMMIESNDLMNMRIHFCCSIVGIKKSKYDLVGMAKNEITKYDIW